MALQVSQQDPDPELQAAFRRHLPTRLRVLLRRTRSQCRSGWDCNVLRALHDEFATLADASGRYGMLEAGERLLALETALAAPLDAHGVPDAGTSAAIDTLLDGLRPHLQDPVAIAPAPAWAQGASAAARDPFPRCEVPPDQYWRRLGIADPVLIPMPAPADVVPVATVAAAPAAPPAAPQPAAAVPAAGASRGARIRIVDDDHPAVNELLLRLEQRHLDVALVDSFDGLLDRLHDAPPELAVIVADERTPLERLATSMQGARVNPAHPVRLLVLLRDPGASLQLRALRAGADRCIALPATGEETLGAALELAQPEPERAYRILIVDDDAPQALFAQAVLRHAGMETLILDQALTVLDELDRFRPDLLLLDLNMPDCDGFELTALVRERDRYMNTPIVFLSGDLDEERQFAALDAGGDDFLVKPIRPTHLVAAVTNRVRRARAAAARLQRVRARGVRGGVQSRAQLLDAVAKHVATSGRRGIRGGLLAVEPLDHERLRERLDAGAYAQLLEQIGAFVAAHIPAGCMTARHGDSGCLVFAPASDESGLLALARGIVDAATDARFGPRAESLALVAAGCAFDADTPDTARLLAALAQTLMLARSRPEHTAVRSIASAAESGASARQIEAALAGNAFGLAFQPVIPILGAAKPNYQALLRLRAAGREFVAAEIVPVAEHAGLIAAIDAWVIRRCVAILTERAAGGELVRLFASQSLAGWRGEARAAALGTALAAAAVPKGFLVVEFQAAAARADWRLFTEVAAALHHAGVGLALAGITASALDPPWPDALPLDYAKLVHGLAGNDLEDAVHAAHGRGLRVIAPCVETVAEVEILRSAGVDLLQGNYFRPPAAELATAVPSAES